MGYMSNHSIICNLRLFCLTVCTLINIFQKARQTHLELFRRLINPKKKKIVSISQSQPGLFVALGPFFSSLEMTPLLKIK